MIDTNPQLRTMVEANPQMRTMLSNPEFLQQMTRPETLQVGGRYWILTPALIPCCNVLPLLGVLKESCPTVNSLCLCCAGLVAGLVKERALLNEVPRTAYGDVRSSFYSPVLLDSIEKL